MLFLQKSLSMNTSIIRKRLEALKNEMTAQNLSAVIIPQNDPHQSEYIAEHWQARRYFSGFTGSAGVLVVLHDKAALWTDSRYFLQASEQLEGTGIELMKDGLNETPSIVSWLVENIPWDSRIGIDGWLFTVGEVDNLKDALEGIATIDTNCRIVENVWVSRPPLPNSKAFTLQVRYAGLSAAKKIEAVRKACLTAAIEATIISALDEIAWMLNLRGSDIDYNPVNYCYLYLSHNRAVLFINLDKLGEETLRYLSENGVDVKPYDKLEDFIYSLPSGEAVMVDETTTSFNLCEVLGESRCVLGNSPVPMLKAIKNDVEQQGIRSAMRRDGAALCKAFRELEDLLDKGDPVTEITVAKLLKKHRSSQPLFFDESFATIAGYGPHGAIVHYEADARTDARLQKSGLLLVDSGAQYLDGTTDITRTISLGNPTAEEKRDFTLVLKGMIALASAAFPAGTRGIQLDTLAHQFLWRAGQNYMHGTGHGIGHFLNVHEGPFSIRNNRSNWEIPLEAGMVTSDEPGLYKEGLYGIRCENVLLVVKAEIPGSDNFEYLMFETLTLFPFDNNLLDIEILSADEIKWLNDYHARVREELSPLLDEKTRIWLEDKTKTISVTKK